jgi:uncharacterized protein (TIGR00297 family)
MNPIDIGVGLAVVILFTLISAKLKLLTKGGMYAALFIGALVAIFGGLTWLSLLLAFYLAAGALTRFRYRIKLEKGTAETKGGARSWTNVFANGGVAALFAVFEGAFTGGIYFGGFLGALSSAASDTLATEVGTLYPNEPRMITRLRRKVKAGTSGALSPYGELGIVVAAILLGVVAFAFHIESWSLPKMLLVSVSAGFVGSTSDSLLGATLQARYYCPTCEEETESNPHKCSSECRLIRGTRFLNNHSVNLVSTMVGGLVGVVLVLLFPA